MRAALTNETFVATRQELSLRQASRFNWTRQPRRLTRYILPPSGNLPSSKPRALLISPEAPYPMYGGGPLRTRLAHRVPAAAIYR
jgi:hypothetical protein